MKINFLTVEEFAKMLNVHPETIRRGIKSGRIHGFRVGNGKRSPFRIYESEIERISVISFNEIVSEFKKEKDKQ
jgi:excisionase family DNA binding protein